MQPTESLPLFKELENPKVALKAVIKADVEAAGGFKDVAEVLWPDAAKKDLIAASQRLMNACNPKQKQELDYYEIQTLKALAREATGASHVHAHESKPLNCKLHWITLQEEAQQVAVSLSDAATNMSAVMVQAQVVLTKLAAASK